ncbi:hypothetical protein pb186bvf_000518 [Paramecium bursaria]
MTEAQLREQKIVNHVWSQNGSKVAVSFRLSNNVAVYEVDQYLEVNKFQQVHSFRDFSLPAQGLAWSSQNMILAGGLDKAIFVYRGNQDKTWSKDLVLCNNSQAVLSGAWSPNGNKFAIGTSCKKVYIGHYEDKNVWWDSTSLPSMNSSVISVKFHPSGRVVGFCGSDNTFRLVSTVLQVKDKKFTELEDQDYDGIFKNVDLWNHEFFETVLNGWINDFSFSPAGDKIIITSHTSQLQLIVIKDGDSIETTDIQKADTYTHKGQPFLKLVFISNDIFVAAGYERKLYVFTTENNQIKQLAIIDKPLASQLQQKALSTTNALKQQLQGQKNKLELQPWEHQLAISSLNYIKDDLVSTSDLNGKINIWKVAI